MQQQLPWRLPEKPTLFHLDVPNIPDFADDFIQKLVNRHVLSSLQETFKIDLSAYYAIIEKTINDPILFNISVYEEEQQYAFDMNGTFIEPIIAITPDSLQCKAAIDFSPTLESIH